MCTDSNGFRDSARGAESFNGWANRETWALVLHITNDQGLSSTFADTLRDERTDPAYAVQRDAEDLFTRAGYVDTFGGPWPDALADIAAEVGSLFRVDWSEVVDALSEVAR